MKGWGFAPRPTAGYGEGRTASTHHGRAAKQGSNCSLLISNCCRVISQILEGFQERKVLGRLLWYCRVSILRKEQHGRQQNHPWLESWRMGDGALWSGLQRALTSAGNERWWEGAQGGSQRLTKPKQSVLETSKERAHTQRWRRKASKPAQPCKVRAKSPFTSLSVPRVPPWSHERPSVATESMFSSSA